MISTLRFLYSSLLLASGIYLYFFFLQNSLGIYTQGELAAFASTFFIVVVFAFLMLVLLAKYLPDNLLGLANIILGPILFVVIDSIVSPLTTVQNHIAQTGITYLSSILIAFIFVVFAYPFRKKATLKMILPQLLFIIPAIVTLYIFGKYIHFTFIPPHLTIKYIYFTLIIFQQAYFLSHQIQSET